MTDAPEPSQDAIAAEIQGSDASERNKSIALSALSGETFAEIGRRHGISGQRAKQIAIREQREAKIKLTDPFGRMTVRAMNSLAWKGIRSVAQLRDYVAENGHPTEWVGRDGWSNFGRKTALEVAKLIGLPESPDDAAPRCPHCGQIIRS